MTYPRSRNGHVDDGSLIKAANRRDRCPNCGSHSYRETMSMESCDACGLRMDYWGGGGNAVYERYMDDRDVRHEAELARKRELECEHQEWLSHSDDNH